MAGMVSCKKDKNEEIDPIGNETDYEDPTYVEGVFNPGRHVATVVGPAISQQWSWSEGSPKQLTGIVDVVNSESYNFSYKGSGRMANSSYRKGNNTFSYSYEYDEGWLDELETRKNGALWLEGSVSHSNSHISRIDYSELSDDFVKTMASRMLNRDLDNFTFNLDEPSFVVNYHWNGQNVVSEDYEASVVGTMTLSQLSTLFEDGLSGSSLGSYAALLPLLIQNMGDSSFMYTVDVNATVEYTYDAKHNPYLGFWGDGLLLNTKALSANNITAANVTGSAHFVSSVVLHLPSECPAWIPSQYQAIWFIIQPFLNGMEIPVDRTIPLDQTQGFTYTYNSIGFPVEYTTQDGKTYSITYKEN